jgi:hypothetical protein
VPDNKTSGASGSSSSPQEQTNALIRSMVKVLDTDLILTDMLPVHYASTLFLILPRNFAYSPYSR